MNTTDLTQLNINVLTQEQYEQAKADETLDADSLYMVNDDIHQMGVELDFEGVEKRELLWTNPNSLDTLAQTELTNSSAGWEVGKKTTDYDGFEIVGKCFGTVNEYIVTKGYWLNNKVILQLTTLVGGQGSAIGTFWYGKRIFEISENSILVYGGFSGVSGGNWSSDNRACIPYKIYGIKKLQPSYNVIPQQVDYVVDNSNGKRVWKSGKDDVYIVEKGIDTSGQLLCRYKKYSDGTCELFYPDFGSSLLSGAAFAGGYYHTMENFYPLPSWVSNAKLKSATPISQQLQFVVGCSFSNNSFKLVVQNGSSAYVSGLNVHLALVFECNWE